MARKKTTEDRSAEHRAAGAAVPDQPGTAGHFAKPFALRESSALKPTGSFYYHCDWHASHYVNVMQEKKPLANMLVSIGNIPLSQHDQHSTN